MSLFRILVNTLSLLLVALILPGFEIGGVTSALVAALLLGIVNGLIRPILLVLTLPLTILTLGLFTLVINAAMLLLVASIVPGFTITSFGWAVLGSIVLSVVSSFISSIRVN